MGEKRRKEKRRMREKEKERVPKEELIEENKEPDCNHLLKLHHCLWLAAFLHHTYNLAAIHSLRLALMINFSSLLFSNLEQQFK